MLREDMSGHDDYAAPAEDSSSRSGLPSTSPTKPYWLQDPSKILLGLRTTAELPATADVVIVGSGITGAFAAERLVHESSSTSVVMLEAREACFGATGRNGGHCQPMVYASTPDVAGFELATLRFLQAFVAKHAVPCDWRTLEGGGVHGYLDGSLFQKVVKLVDVLRQKRPDLAEQITVASTAEALHKVRLRPEAAAGAVVQANAASVWPYKLVAWVLEQLTQSSHFNLQTTTPVLAVHRTTSGNWAVVTSRGTIAARAVLLATNGYLSNVLPSMADLVVPVRGQVAALVPPEQMTTTIDGGYVFAGVDPQHDDIDSDEYLVQRPFETETEKTKTKNSGHLILGGGRQLATGHAVREWRDDEVEPAVATYLRRRLVPVLEMGQPDTATGELKADFEWTGIMGFSRDGHPWVGPVPASLLDDQSRATLVNTNTNTNTGLYVCAGYTGHGMPNATLSGRVVANMIQAGLQGKTGEAEASLTTTLEADPSAATAALPRSYLITEERIAAARAKNEVGVQELSGLEQDVEDLLAYYEAL